MNVSSLAETVRIPMGGRLWLEADLTMPRAARGLVLFAHGSSSGRHSPRTQFVASTLHELRFATLLADLLTGEEDPFDIALLTHRVVELIDWAVIDLEPAPAIGLFSASTGAAAALDAAALRPKRVRAVVSRGGRPDLASRLSDVEAPALLIAGGNDRMVVELNEIAATRLTCENELEIIPGATHLFEEEGALRLVAEMAAHWFERHLASRPD